MKLLKSIIVFIILFLSTFIGYKSYIVLNFTLGNTLHGIYNGYVLADKGIEKTVEMAHGVKNTIISIKSKVLDTVEEKKILDEKIKEEKVLTKKEKLNREKEIKYMNMFIDLIIILISIGITYKVFTMIINPIIDEESIIRKIIRWVQNKKDND